jgi:hypothetical protein
MARKREFTTFSLSFLDIMSCGLGAVALIFLIIKHETNVQIDQAQQDLQAEVNLLEEEVLDGEEHLVKLRNTLSELDMQMVDADGLARRINNDITAVRDKIKELKDDDTDQQIEALEAELKTLAEQKKEIEEELKKGNDMRRIAGQGERQYLTGLQLGGNRVLVLLDASASMLDSTIVNVIRRRNMSDDTKKASAKWQRAVATVEWLAAQFSIDAHYQIYTFNTKVSASIANTETQWLPVSDQEELERSILNLREVVPQKGTSLERAFQSIAGLNPLPDNILLITDGLPTQGLTKPKRNTITGPDRLELYENAVDILPPGIPVNIMLWPMEGDPMAAAAFWKLAQFTAGSFLSPSKDWP